MLTRYETDTSNFDPIDPDKLRPENEERWEEDFIFLLLKINHNFVEKKWCEVLFLLLTLIKNFVELKNISDFLVLSFLRFPLNC